jgi:hypothetical protein
VSKILGFLLGVVVALAGPAVFGVLAAPGGIELTAKELALAFGIGALIFWAVVSYFSGAGALGAFVAFGTLIYSWLWIPNRTSNFLNNIPGVTNGMIDGSKQYTLNGVVPILAVISLVYAIQLIVRGVQRRRRVRAEAERLQREQEAAQAQQEADAAAVYPVAASTYPAEQPQYVENFGNSHRFDDLFDDEPEQVRPRSQADEQTATFPAGTAEQTREFGAAGNHPGEETELVPTDRDATVQVPASSDPDATQLAPSVSESDVTHEAGSDAARDEGAAEAPRAPGNSVQQEESEAVAEVPVAVQEQETSAGAEADSGSGRDQEPPAGSGAGGAPVQGQVTAAGPEQVSDGSARQAPIDPPGEEPKASSGGKAETGQQPGHDGDATRVEPQAAAPKAEQPGHEGDATRVEPQAAAPEAEQPGDGKDATRVDRQERVGSQYRERMDSPEDTGEFHITAFENPVVRPAGA